MPAKKLNLHTTILQAFARTVLDESRPPGEDAVSGPDEPRRPTELPGEGDVVGGLYKLIRVLGEGMFGKVYVAQRIDVPEHQVALKLLPRSLYAGRNVERELVMLATVGHPNVVQLKDHGTTDDYVWLTMPVYEGETLAERLERSPLDLRQAYDIFLPIARGLEALHAAGLRHQDIKPDNIYLALFGGRVHPIVLDLGVAVEKDAPFVAGTALYAAPEQVAALGGMSGELSLSEKMDTYGLATTLLVSLVGPEHFPGEMATDRAELSEAHEVRARDPFGDDALPELTGRPRELLREAFRRLLALEPEMRPSMQELAEMLELLLEPEREAEREEARRRNRQKTSLLRFKAALGIVAVAALAGAALVCSEREMLRIASALQEAKKRGAESFDKLDTCVMSHRMATHDLATCKEARERERSEFQKSLDEVAKSGSSSEAEYARQIGLYATRVKTCEDNAAAAQKTCDEETMRILDQSARDKDALTAERDAQKKLAEERQKKIQELEKERDACVLARDECEDERDVYPVPPSAPPPPPVPPAPSSAPSASSAPASTSSPAPSATVVPSAPPPKPTASAPPAPSAPPPPPAPPAPP